MAERRSVLKTNWFSVHDLTAFNAFIASVPGDFTVHTRSDADGSNLKVRFDGYDEQPGLLVDPDTDEEIGDFEDELAKHIANDDTVSIVELVHTGLTEVNAYICAVTSDGVLACSSFVDDFHTMLVNDFKVPKSTLEM